LGKARLFQKLPLPRDFPTAAAGYIGGDGMKVDGQGRVINAQYGAGRLLVSDAEGKLLGQIDIPVPYVTNVNFTATPGELVVTGMSDGFNEPFPGIVGLVSMDELRPVERGL
jgi:sugar lactone lactonase YvrE